MSFLDQVFSQVCSMHLPVTSNEVYMAMKDHVSMGILSPAAKRDKIRKALSDLRHKRGVLTAKNDNDGLLWWDLAFYSKPSAVATLPEKIPEPPKEPCTAQGVHKQLLTDIGNAFLKAAEDL